MKKQLLLLTFSVFMIVQCTLQDKKKPVDPASDQPVVKTAEQIAAEEKIKQDSIQNAAQLEIQKTAFGDLKFEMDKGEVEKLNEKRQKLGKYYYDFSYSFNGAGELFKVKMNSDGKKTILYDADLKNNYNNLLQIVKAKYGEPVTNTGYPSVFDVQDVKKYQINKWELGNKEIVIGLQQLSLNSYCTYCEIFDKNMQEAETARLNRIKNKDILDASDKF